MSNYFLSGVYGFQESVYNYSTLRRQDRNFSNIRTSLRSVFLLKSDIFQSLPKALHLIAIVAPMAQQSGNTKTSSDACSHSTSSQFGVVSLDFLLHALD